VEFQVSDFTNFQDLIGMTKTLKRKRYISPNEIKRYCPKVQISKEFEPGMMTYEIVSDKLQEFFRENNVTRIVVKPEFYKRSGPIQMEQLTTVIIKCRVEKNVKS
jgi:hypothetical protein